MNTIERNLASANTIIGIEIATIEYVYITQTSEETYMHLKFVAEDGKTFFLENRITPGVYSENLVFLRKEFGINMEEAQRVKSGVWECKTNGKKARIETQLLERHKDEAQAVFIRYLAI